VDLIYGLPGQREESFAQDFATLAAQGIHSVTVYNLRVNENTPIGRALSEAEKLNLQRLMHWRAFVKATAEQLGFEQTRYHTFRRLNPATAADVASRFADITGQGNQFGIGVSARSRLNNRVYRNNSQKDTYLQRIASGESPVEETMDLNEGERKIRFLALSLGDGKALNRQDYLRQFGCPFDEDFAEPLERLQRVELISDDGEQVTMTERGKLLYDLVMRAFYPRHLQQWMEERKELVLTSPNLRPRVKSQ
jgi:oxygen-independent coproporphyrinogen-3 oxidase